MAQQSNSNELETRLDRLEEHAADQARQIDDLNQVITDQWTLMEKMKRDISRLTDELADMGDSDEHGRVTKPPHY